MIPNKWMEDQPGKKLLFSDGNLPGNEKADYDGFNYYGLWLLEMCAVTLIKPSNELRTKVDEQRATVFMKEI